MNSNKDSELLTVRAIMAAIPYFFVTLIILIWIIISITSVKIDPLDASLNKNTEVVEHLKVTDSMRNGFRVVYATTKSVTSARLEEIRSRPHVKESFRKLSLEAPLHFENMLYTDIYDFARFALNYDVDPDIEMHNIFVCGPDKEKLYIGDNPKIQNPAKYINSYTSQGLLYLKRNDIYYHRPGRKKVYRYWKCPTIHQTSETDEHFSHFSESDRLYD